MRTAFLFPGQGSQAVGMGRACAGRSSAAAEIFERADRALGLPLTELCWEGPIEELNLTANTQPAILTASIAVLAALRERGRGERARGDHIEPVVVAGHSLGEYTALVAAGSLELEDALRLVRRRGELMQEAVPVGEGAMAAVLGLAPDGAAALAAEAASGDEICAVANLNSPVQTVLAGHAAAVDRAVAAAQEHGARRAVVLPVSAPFHSPLMAPAREGLTPLLDATDFADPRVPVISNVDAAAVTRGATAREALRRQIDSPVRWIESVEAMRRDHRVDRFIEVGPGSVLTGLVRRILDGVEAVSLGEPDDLDLLNGISKGASEEAS